MAAKVTFEFPADAWAGIVTAFAETYDWQAEVPDPENPGQNMPNPQTAEDFTIYKIKQFVANVWQPFAVKAATAAAIASASAAVAARADAVSAATTVTVENLEDPPV